MAKHAGLTEAEVIALHTGREYRIYMLGFLPGFPYLGGLDERLFTPRLNTPRTAIPAGAVGIGGEQTGIYPIASPGGWQLIGRTPRKLFDPKSGALPYTAGDRIKFETHHRGGICSPGGKGGHDMSITVLDPGPLTTVQDAGRVGYAAQGYRSCGAADGYTYRLGNVLVGNDPGAAVLECTLRGAALRFETDTVFALTGAESPAALDSTPIPYYAPLLAKAGSVLQMGAAKTGLRSYLAVGGGIATPPVLGSRATDVKCGIGGLEGRKLTAGDTLPIGSCDTAALWQAITAKRLDRPLRDKAVCGGLHPMRVQGTQMLPMLRAVPGPQDAAFTVQGRQDFIHGIYTLTPDCDRMACKLAGTPLQMRRGADILSDGIVPGSVQVSADGQPIVMLADHQTTGGYAKIATVISADLPALAQLRPGQRVCFTFVTPSRAVQAAPAAGGPVAAGKRSLVKEGARYELFRISPG